MSELVSRRGFVVGAASTAIAAGTLKGASLAVSPAFAEETAGESLEIIPLDTENATEYACDVVVIGTGGAGMCAIVQAAENGLNVIGVENFGYLGGGLYGVEAHYTLDCKATQEAGMSDEIQSPLDAYTYHMDFNRWRANARLVRMFTEECATSIDWLVDDVGCTIADGGVMWGLRGPGGSAGIMFLNQDANGNYAKGGIHLANKLVAKAEEFDNARFLLETHANNLIQDDSGRVIGVACTDKDGNVVKVSAGAVIIATGGFANSPEMLEKYCGHNEALACGTQGHKVAGGMGGHYGEGIRMAWAAGAAEEGIRFYDCTIEQVEGEVIDSPVHRAAREPYLYVNKLADRFSNESNYKIIYQPDGMYYSLFDSDMVEMMENNPTIKTTVYTPSHNDPIEGLSAALDAAVESGNIIRADTIEGLAEAAGIDAAKLVATVKEYNATVDEGVDWWFHKDVNNMHKVQTPPFYMCKMICGILNTTGGVKVTEKLEAVNAEMMTIPGLYVIGNDAGGCYGCDYNHLDSGWASAFAFWSGRAAANNAATYIENEGIVIESVMPEATTIQTADETGDMGADGIAAD